MPRNATRQPTQRPLRVGEELRHALARILGRGELRDPALVDVAVTVTEVRVAPDLKSAAVFVMPLAGAHASEIVAALNRAGPYLRRAVMREVNLRHAPELTILLDTAFDHASRISALLGRPVVARELAGEDRDDGA